MNKKQGNTSTQAVMQNDRADDLTVILTFSGGGTRAAGLSYGVLEKLRDTTITINNKKRRLLDEVDLISSVSGGSFTSAYYGLFGDEIFQRFDKAFLKRKIQSELIDRTIRSPRSWVKLLPGFYERSDLAAEYYGNNIFRNKKFKDLRKNAPFIVINATDLSLGHGFAFTNYHFSWICSDLQKFPIARAVAASSAVPVIFSPITLENHSGSCGYSPIIWSSNGPDSDKRYEQALAIKKYRDSTTYKYLHLVDGGVSDNLGIRSILDLVTYHRNNIWNLMRSYKMSKTKKLVFIVVDASGVEDIGIGKSKLTPTTVKVLKTTMDLQFNKYNVETLDLLRNQFPKWKKQITKGRCKSKGKSGCADIDFHLIEVSLKDIKNKDRYLLLSIPTTLELPEDTIDKLKQAGSDLLDDSKAFQKLKNSLN